MTVDADYAFDPSDPTTAKNPGIYGTDSSGAGRRPAQ